MKFNVSSSNQPQFTSRSYASRLILGISIIGLTCALNLPGESQTTRPRRSTNEQQPSAGKKIASKPKPLAARDHRQAEQRLAELGYWVGRIDGRWDNASRHALVAFQKVEGLKPTGRLTQKDFDVLMNASRPSAFEDGDAHIEVDLVRQVLFVVDDAGTVTKILPVSTGSGKDFYSEGWTRAAITHPGRYKTYQKIAGWKKSPLGRMYYPVYFMWGTAIHGYQSVPTKPASHGCVRIPMFAAREFYKATPIGMRVLVHKGEPLAPKISLTDQ
jgi:peptidoglycan hydrolase-like protein with peptidoglycan-binding domain